MSDSWEERKPSLGRSHFPGVYAAQEASGISSPCLCLELVHKEDLMDQIKSNANCTVVFQCEAILSSLGLAQDLWFQSRGPGSCG